MTELSFEFTGVEKVKPGARITNNNGFLIPCFKCCDVVNNKRLLKGDQNG